MTLYEEIQTKCPELIALGNFHDIASAVNVDRKKSISMIGGIGTVLLALGSEGGAALLDSLEVMAATDSKIKYALKMIDSGTLDFGLDETRTMITAIVPSPAKEALLAISEVPDTVSWEQCRTAVQGV